jgi:rhodanese-related sulfurtransferase
MATKQVVSGLTRSLSTTRSYRLSSSERQCSRQIRSLTWLPQGRHNLSISNMPMRQPKRHFTTTLANPRDTPSSPSSNPAQKQSKVYLFEDIQSLSQSPSPHRIIIDVREPAELASTGKIPTAQNLPISTSADGFFLGAEEFEERFGFPKPGGEDEVVFYCKAGVRSRAAAQIAIQAGFGGRVGEFPGSWIEWKERGGDVEKVK